MPNDENRESTNRLKCYNCESIGLPTSMIWVQYSNLLVRVFCSYICYAKWRDYVKEMNEITI